MKVIPYEFLLLKRLLKSMKEARVETLKVYDDYWEILTEEEQQMIITSMKDISHNMKTILVYLEQYNKYG